jgi:hypothetical protein
MVNPIRDGFADCMAASGNLNIMLTVYAGQTGLPSVAWLQEACTFVQCTPAQWQRLPYAIKYHYDEKVVLPVGSFTNFPAGKRPPGGPDGVAFFS